MLFTSSDIEPRLIDDYDFVFMNGLVWPISIDRKAGDDIAFMEDRIEINIAERKDPNTPKEHQTLYLKNIALIQHRERYMVPQSPEQRDEYKELLKKVSKTVH